jgi:hypothetical protein
MPPAFVSSVQKAGQDNPEEIIVPNLQTSEDNHRSFHLNKWQKIFPET